MLLAANYPLLPRKGCQFRHGQAVFAAGIHDDPAGTVQFTIRCVAFPDDQKMIDIGDYYGDFPLFREATGWEPKTNLKGLDKRSPFTASKERILVILPMPLRSNPRGGKGDSPIFAEHEKSGQSLILCRDSIISSSTEEIGQEIFLASTRSCGR